MRSIVDVEIVDDVIVLPPIKVVLPPCKAKILLLRFRVPMPWEIVLPLMVVAVSWVMVVVASVDVPVTFKAPLIIWLPPRKNYHRA
jgi:hypothetical protein